MSAADKAGIIFDPIPQVPGWLEENSFVDVSEHPRIVPLGPWPKDKHLKEIGRYFRCQFTEGALEAYSLKLLTSVGGWSTRPSLVRTSPSHPSAQPSTPSPSWKLAPFPQGLPLTCSAGNEEVQVLIAHVRNEIKSNKMHIYTYWCVFRPARAGMSFQVLLT